MSENKRHGYTITTERPGSFQEVKVRKAEVKAERDLSLNLDARTWTIFLHKLGTVIKRISPLQKPPV